MDPNANIDEQRALAEQIERFPESEDANEHAALGQRLAELVLALDEWRQKGGFDPYPAPDAQAAALARLMRDRPEQDVAINRHWFDLPDGWWHVTFTPSNFTCGIAPDGSVSS